MQGFTLILAVGAIILSCGPQFSAAANGSILYATLTGEQKTFPVSIGPCQQFPEPATIIHNTTPFFILGFPLDSCRGEAFHILPGQLYRPPPNIRSFYVRPS
jgi:hypothetical protein